MTFAGIFLLSTYNDTLLLEVTLRLLTPSELTYFSCNVGFSSLPGEARNPRIEGLERLLQTELIYSVISFSSYYLETDGFQFYQCSGFDCAAILSFFSHRHILDSRRRQISTKGNNDFHSIRDWWDRLYSTC